MDRKTMLTTAAGALLLLACAMQDGGAPAAAASSQGATAELHDATGKVVGMATATQAGDGILIKIAGTALPAGVHGAHVHTVGTCTAPDFQSAGGHWNPTGMQHGKDNPAGMHKGDLPNLTVGSDGHGATEYTIAGATIAGGLLDADGSALVIHAQADDYRTDPTGNSGARIACGVFH